jgi:hypothetical protein
MEILKVTFVLKGHKGDIGVTCSITPKKVSKHTQSGLKQALKRSPKDSYLRDSWLGHK